VHGLDERFGRATWVAAYYSVDGGIVHCGGAVVTQDFCTVPRGDAPAEYVADSLRVVKQKNILFDKQNKIVVGKQKKTKSIV
jgi:hypothetical protein